MLPNDLESYWIPFTPQRHFKKSPRLLAAASGMYYKTPEGREILDGVAGLWCVNAGHGRKEIVDAITQQAQTLDYAPGFNYSHPIAFEAANRLCADMPGDMDHVFFCNSGSEAVDTALKIALAYHHAKGQPQRFRLVGRARAYHGVNFGGIAVGGISFNRKVFGPGVAGTFHLPHTHNLEYMAFSRGQPDWGAHLAEALEEIVLLNDPSTIAAVIVEPVAGSTGVLIPPKGYLERLRQICDKHGILLIFDEVITAWGRLGYASAAERFGIMPDIITSAKGLTNGAVPMGAAFVRRSIYDAFMQGPEELIEFCHGYTYSGHPLACAAAIATAELYRREDLYARARKMEPVLEAAMHSLKGAPHVVDVRNLGMMSAVELAPPAPGKVSRAMEAYLKCFEDGVMLRFTGNTVAVAPPLIVEESQIDRIVTTLRGVLAKLA